MDKGAVRAWESAGDGGGFIGMDTGRASKGDILEVTKEIVV